MARDNGGAGRPVAARFRDAHQRHRARALFRAGLQAAGHGAQTAAQRVLATRREPSRALVAIRDESRARQRAVPRDVLLVLPRDRERDGLFHSIRRQSARGRGSQHSATNRVAGGELSHGRRSQVAPPLRAELGRREQEVLPRLLDERAADERRRLRAGRSAVEQHLVSEARALSEQHTASVGRSVPVPPARRRGAHGEQREAVEHRRRRVPENGGRRRRTSCSRSHTKPWRTSWTA